MFEDRRLESRQEVPRNHSVAWLHVRDRAYPVLVLEQSHGGVGVTIRQPPPVTLGKSVTIERLTEGSELRGGVVRHTQQLRDDCWLIGVEWFASDVPREQHDEMVILTANR